MKDVLGIYERVMRRERNLCLDVVIYVEELDPFKSTIGVAPEDGPNSLALDA